MGLASHGANELPGCGSEAHRYDRDLRLTAGTFLDKLADSGVGLLLDLRQRRGVRGPNYSWANSALLQSALAAAGIGYWHVKELAPTTELRQLQYRVDDRQGVGRRNRIALAPEYTQRYTREILDPSTSALSWRSFQRLGDRPALRRARSGGMPPHARSRAPTRRARHVGHRHPAGLTKTGSLQVQGVAGVDAGGGRLNPADSGRTHSHLLGPRSRRHAFPTGRRPRRPASDKPGTRRAHRRVRPRRRHVRLGYAKTCRRETPRSARCRRILDGRVRAVLEDARRR
jgi:hypothetical protein